MALKYKGDIFSTIWLLILVVLLAVAYYIKYELQTKINAEALASSKEALFEPLITKALPSSTINIEVCDHNTSTTVTTCNIVVSTNAPSQLFLECTHNFSSKQTNCSLKEPQ